VSLITLVTRLAGAMFLTASLKKVPRDAAK